MSAIAEPFHVDADATASRIDYITAFWNEGALERFPEATFLEAIHEQEAAGNEFGHRASDGIEWYGAGGISVGHRNDERFFRASGDGASRLWREAAQTCCSVSRIDPATDCSFASPQRSAGERAARGFKRLRPAAGKPRKFELTISEDGGETFAVGSRTSQVYLRLYDWGVAHRAEEPGCRWRFEAELKGRRATRAAALLLASETEELAISALVRTLYTDRRVSCPWDAETLRSVMETRKPTDTEKRLKWLSSQVGPSVAKLVKAGYLEDVVKALGLTDRVTITKP